MIRAASGLGLTSKHPSNGLFCVLHSPAIIVNTL